jgi:hypothetical protein
MERCDVTTTLVKLQASGKRAAGGGQQAAGSRRRAAGSRQQEQAAGTSGQRAADWAVVQRLAASYKQQATSLEPRGHNIQTTSYNARLRIDTTR